MNNDKARERVARAIASEIGMQDDGEPFILPDDLKLAWLDQGAVDFGKVARAAIEAMGASDRVEKLEAAFEKANSLIDLREQGMIAERKAEYGSRFTNEQEANIRVTHYQLKTGAKIMLDAALSDTAPPALSETPNVE